MLTIVDILKNSCNLKMLENVGIFEKRESLKILQFTTNTKKY